MAFIRTIATFIFVFTLRKRSSMECLPIVLFSSNMIRFLSSSARKSRELSLYSISFISTSSVYGSSYVTGIAVACLLVEEGHEQVEGNLRVMRTISYYIGFRG